MGAVAKQIVDDALDKEQLTLPPGATIGSIYLKVDQPGCNWDARFSGTCSDSWFCAAQAIVRIQARFPLIDPAEIRQADC